MNKFIIYSAFKDLFGDFCQVSSVTMPASLPPQLAKLIQKYPQNHSHINLNSFLKDFISRDARIAPSSTFKKHLKISLCAKII